MGRARPRPFSQLTHVQEYGVLLGVLVALLMGLAAGKAWERYKLQEGRWIDRRKIRQSPHFILGLNHLVAGQVDLAIEEMRFAREVSDRVVFIDHGTIVEQGDPETLFTAPQTPRLRSFLGSMLR